MDLSQSNLIDTGLETPVNEDNLTEEEKLLIQKDKELKESKPWSVKRCSLLQDAVKFHQDRLIEEIKELENEINSKKGDFWKMEGSKEFLKNFIEE